MDYRFRRTVVNLFIKIISLRCLFTRKGLNFSPFSLKITRKTKLKTRRVRSWITEQIGIPLVTIVGSNN